jgi:RNA polymerase sigma-70 factor (ECF subfamily)
VSGDLVPLAEQDRSAWDRGLIAEGQAIVRRCVRINRPGPYQIQAAINAVHSDAPTAAATDWPQILQLYDQLLALSPSPIVALNRAVAVAEVAGPESALVLVDPLDLRDYYLYHAIRADLLRRLGRSSEAVQTYGAAIARTANVAERTFLERRRLAVERAGLEPRATNGASEGKREDVRHSMLIGQASEGEAAELPEQAVRFGDWVLEASGPSGARLVVRAPSAR